MFSTNKTLDRIHSMLDNAINGNSIETTFDESKVSSIESKLQKYLMTTQTHKDDLREQQQRINQLISDISHQTKTPLSNIMLYCELLNECHNEKDKEKYTTCLLAQTEKLNFLISSLVKTSRLENGIIAPTPILQKIDTLFSQLKLIFPQINILEKSTFHTACYDLKWTAEAIENIIDNAYKYGATTVSISSTFYDMFCKLDITDNGIGMHEEMLPKIFTRFYRGDATSNSEGVGIGLYLTREIISKQGGYIKVNSRPNQGSTFSVYLARDLTILSKV